jgi:hypothetical protein
MAFVVLIAKNGGFSALRVYVGGRSPDALYLTELGSYVWYAPRLVVPASFCLFALAVRQRSRKIGIGAAFALAATLLLTVPMGARIFLLPLLGGIVVFVYVHRRKRPSVFALLALMVIALFASYAAVIVREPGRRESAGSQFAMLVERPSQVFHLVLYRGDAEMAPALAGALTVVPERLGYRYGGASIGALFVRPIPRQLWHGKPEPDGRRIVAAVWPDLTGYFEPSYSTLLSFYWDFGIAGVLAGMVMFGIGCRALYEWFLRHADSFGAQLIFSVALWFVVVETRDGPVDTVVFAGVILLPLVLLERFSALRRTRLRRLDQRPRLSAR